MDLLKKNWVTLVFLIIVVVASFLRLYKLGEVPGSLDWDEASLGWNAYSLFKTGTDEYGKALPVSIRSFNDFKPPLYVYAAIPTTAIFGLNEFSVRLPSAIAGILTVVVTYFLVKRLTKNETLAILTTLLLAISPWHLQFSRAAFEANLSLFFFVLGVYLLLKFPLLSVFPFVLSIYSYHSPRLVIPAFLFLLFIFYFKKILKSWKLLFVSGALFLVLLYPLVRNTLHVGSVTARLNSVSVVSSPTEYLSNYLSHYNFDFLFLNADDNGRHHVPGFGLLYLGEFPFLLAGIYFLIKNRPSWLKFLLAWIVAAPVASALVIDSPHAIRSLLFLPTFQIITSYGILKILTKKTALIVLTLYLVNFTFYFHQYYVHFPVEHAKDWQYGYKQVVKKVLASEDNYTTIYMTNFYDQPYIYFLFYGRVAPIVKNSSYFYQAFDKYEFGRFKDDKRALYVLSPTELNNKYQVFDQVNFPDGKPAFLFATIK
ncbi:hypothetical protein A2872_02830 [Candidatus Gottesmanbacteria bacterium RIFCSPHIGHO2_01_FULL_42_12]|uniref:ArnT-like N-terminal domain-containing protein n=1 Tax=Candidatus Gottesmanbacteria bacterium RIFCSPHIGHO2_01_FULL_42_12 TaxID=1798377 RepID=A0A1F5Z4S5_9BACT|nr:MAG: hypothetical protein A2872_02830 [Candidatus Gottesmanbacteria bacterium RIFCSPHIGHO2_01_FULL_42_12]